MFPIADLHCDLLYYLLLGEGRTAYDEKSRCSLPQLKRGGVFLQVLAVFTETEKGSALLGRKQFEIYESLFLRYPEEINKLSRGELPHHSSKINTLIAFENASSLCEENEPLYKTFPRLDIYQERAGIAYVSLTWNGENRFGGGVGSSIGLKKDGEELLIALDAKKIPIDLSHASDHLAYDIFNFIEKKNLSIVPIASHSNFRSVTCEERNLPEEFTKEILKRGGIIGLNFVKKFIGSSLPEAFFAHIEYIHRLNGIDALCIGADFFSGEDFKEKLSFDTSFFHDEFDTSDCYPKFLQELSKKMDDETIKKIAYKNVETFLLKMHIMQKAHFG